MESPRASCFCNSPNALSQVALGLFPLFQGAPPEGAFVFVPAAEGQDHRQGDLTVAEIIADGLAQVRLQGRVVEHVIDDLEGNTQV